MARGKSGLETLISAQAAAALCPREWKASPQVSGRLSPGYLPLLPGGLLSRNGAVDDHSRKLSPSIIGVSRRLRRPGLPPPLRGPRSLLPGGHGVPPPTEPCAHTLVTQVDHEHYHEHGPQVYKTRYAFSINLITVFPEADSLEVRPDVGGLTGWQNNIAVRIIVTRDIQDRGPQVDPQEVIE